MKSKIIIYTDGAARGNPGPAGWGAIIIDGKKVFEIGGASKHATNNQMELTAPIEALKYMKNSGIYPHPASPYGRGRSKEGVFEVFSDSKYVILGITEWIFNWQKNNWRNAAKKPVLNKELWEELYELTKLFKIKWIYVEGHNGNKWNERADEIATNFADGNEIRLKNGK
ncbi:MAG: ribonuclease H [Candidatus Paceibacterota bacterium]